MAGCPYNITTYLLLLKYPVVGSGVSVTHCDAPSVRLKVGLNYLHWHWNAINILCRIQEDMTVPSYLDAVFCEASSRLISLVKKKIHIFDLVRLHIAWIKFYVRVWEFFNSAHTPHCSLQQFSQFNKKFGRQSLPISSCIKMSCEILSIRVEKEDEPFRFVLCCTACVKHQNIF